MQGDIIGIVDKDSTVVARYSYDAWGKVRSVKNSDNDEITSESHIAIINPFRYRGYYFDQGTNLYYLQSRYYNFEVGRFVNGDEFINLQSSLGNYIFAYCENNSINYFDTEGTTKNPIQYEYDPKKALKYAEKWWNKRNSDFYSYGSDCANFVSQCLYAGKFSRMSGVGRNDGWHSYKSYKKVLFWKKTVWDVSASWSTVKGLINWIILFKHYTRHYIRSKK